ncbi:AAA+ ATPase superfamily predicted ATPase [Lactobacillus colini]|uniref:AAA+ ATPase superfamily predicted ATPase n=1 Tax=Lactobacillus colini TaxID=1819254 RepID=A0ABS4MFK4_9LACO|nr:ATP-binding protein [Lactobacillus colini]MBP2058482.1 AAA+ ATPase superfamily predicted ATPase [Lactobacillus colini]
MFIGRTEELTKLEGMYQTNTFQFAVIYGRRRIGKTALINRFIQDKDSIYFVGLEENAHDNLVRFSTAIANFEREDSELEGFSYGNFENCFKEITRIARKKKIVLVIDEYPYLAQAAPEISSMLQSYIDHEFKETNLFLILCGSSMSFMENQVLAYKSPLYGRRTGQFKLQPFTLQEAEQYFPNMKKEDAFVLNTITGGIPLYLSYMSEDKTLLQNIQSNILEVNAPLFQETDSLLKQELRDPTNYNSVINAIAAGASRVNDIATKAHLETSAVSAYLKNLIDLGIVEKKVPVTDEAKPRPRKTIYQIKDGLFRFWHTYVSKYMNAILRGASSTVLNIIQKDLNNFMGPEFEKLAQNYLWQHVNDSNIIPDPFIYLGNWWGTDNRNKKQVELDVVGIGVDEYTGYFGECKWKNEPISRSILEKLVDLSTIFPYPKKYYFLFSKSGFTDSCKELAKKLDCQLIDFKQM